MSDQIIAIIVWVGFACIFGYILWQKFAGKRKYKDVEFSTDPNWFENSVAGYPEDDSLRGYFFHYDKNYTHQGHIIEDENHNTAYEIKVLYNNGLQADETDFVNHILNRTHHHKLGKVVSTGVEGGGVGTAINSSFKLDGKDIFGFLHSKGYDYKFHVKKLAYYIDVIKDGEIVAEIYSSNNGKNLYDRDTDQIVPKAGGKGLLVFECAYADLDATVLYALAFARTELSIEQMKH